MADQQTESVRLTDAEMGDIVSNIAGDYDPLALRREVERIVADRLAAPEHADAINYAHHEGFGLGVEWASTHPEAAARADERKRMATAVEAALACPTRDIVPDPPCCGGWGEVRDGDSVAACPTCYPDAYPSAATEGADRG